MAHSWLPFPSSTGDLRFRRPQANNPYSGAYDATSFALSCPQQDVTLPFISGLAQEATDAIIASIYGTVFPDSEDCEFTFELIAGVGLSLRSHQVCTSMSSSRRLRRISRLCLSLPYVQPI